MIGAEKDMKELSHRIHVVKKGDTLYLIAQQYGVKVNAVIFANPYTDVYNLRPGDELCIPAVKQYS